MYIYIHECIGMSVLPAAPGFTVSCTTMYINAYVCVCVCLRVCMCVYIHPPHHGADACYAMVSL